MIAIGCKKDITSGDRNPKLEVIKMLNKDQSKKKLKTLARLRKIVLKILQKQI